MCQKHEGKHIFCFGFKASPKTDHSDCLLPKLWGCLAQESNTNKNVVMQLLLRLSR